MKEIDLIQKIGSKRRATRSVDLIAKIKMDHLDTNHWVYPIGYGFRDAIDIRYDERVKDKKKYMVWTQGPIISFKEGDFICSGCKCFALQVEFAQPMGWNVEKDLMYLGNVVFKFFKQKAGKFALYSKYECDQVGFLALLINGNLTGFKKMIL
ncbi:hypothetical protein [Shewanella subflava]|uniref:YopX protein domain-containing protein n=1 Tax=Shewanella subflava TaxID=2986476 RepID=A0ABT3I5W8_9GAMM|nr:hypothetical protein [Shewanella subflava]MCW3171403.1 hypothetical protein [Shewanella subflava]